MWKNKWFWCQERKYAEQERKGEGKKCVSQGRERDSGKCKSRERERGKSKSREKERGNSEGEQRQ